MIVKKYLVTDIKEAFEKIRGELGKDAVILSTRKVKKGGFLGIGAKTYLEVTAAVEEKKTPQTEEKGQIYKLQEILSKTKQPQQSTEDLTELKRMMLELKSMVASQRANEPQWVQDLRKALEKQDVDEEITEKVIEYAKVKYQELDFGNENTRLILSEMFLPFMNTSIPEMKGKVLFVGPTGVGKTTTLAKLAAKLKLNDHKRVGIITLDTYRIAAVDQLKTYAMLLDVPIRVAYTPKEAKLEVEALSDYDVILIDSAGRSQKNELHMTEIKAMAEVVDPDLVFLIIGMQYRAEDVREIADRFSIVSPTHVVLSKMDETSSYGHFVNVPTFLNVPIAYVTNGQRVPDDIMEANSRELAVLLAREVLKNARSGK
ncbi:flagellar biosynthesis protein FlhF [Fervidobacterium changbaicum]|uniref:Flagellar biosynthesis protein FlhF n=2 Tax=Fervidobacterium TaxID=2422 RepID=A0AAI8GC79_FERIS|nr:MULTISPECIES: flagellar biosynthesis protein FlhF [Fervidobacterium]AMW32044.1 flagellar biosynthesis protein FlhF [Fervidobacterium islandicum]QAV33831.1 flagellar biosynthesis protein FlhF [Fervidobacterium changbaicum]SDH44731.1 flagellar biosynthesis protein FlhF [Fervidobacterium changbaicum]